MQQQKNKEYITKECTDIICVDIVKQEHKDIVSLLNEANSLLYRAIDELGHLSPMRSFHLALEAADLSDRVYQLLEKHGVKK